MSDANVHVCRSDGRCQRFITVADEIPGYDYGSENVAKSPITLQEFEQLKHSATFTEEDEHWLYVAGDILADQLKNWSENGEKSSPRRNTWQDAHRNRMARKTLVIRRGADYVFSNGFSIPVCARTIRTGLTINRKWHCSTPALRKTKPTTCDRHQQFIFVT